MPTEFFAFEMLTGRRIVPLPVSNGSWRIGVNADEAIRCTIPARSVDAKKLDVWGSTTLARHGLLAVVDGLPTAAGPLWKRSYTQGGTIELTAGGLRSYFDRRVLVPVAARTTGLVDENGVARPEHDTSLVGYSYGTIAKKWIELARLWPGGNIPMTFPADVPGPYERHVAAVDLKKLRGLLDALSNVENGPDLAFPPKFTPDGLGIYWEMQTGTTAAPQLGKADPSLVSWHIGAPVGGASGLSVTEDATGLAEEVFTSAGRSSDRLVMARGRNPYLYDAGFPLLQGVDTSHSTVSDLATAQSYADRGAELGRYASSFWKMTVRAKEKGTPKLGDYWIGDRATLIVDKAEPVLPPGEHVRRIAQIGGDERGDSFDIVFSEALV